MKINIGERQSSNFNTGKQNIHIDGVPAGPTGGGDKHYFQDFNDAASVMVAHGLSKQPAVSVINSAGDEVVGDVEYLDQNNLIVSFSASFSGRVICN